MKRMKNPSLDVDVDPVLAAIAGAVILFGGGAAAYGATRDTEPRSPAPAIAQTADPVVARALKIVSRTDGTVPAADAAAAADEAKAAKAASAKGRGTDPFPVTKDATTASSAGSSTASAPGTATNVASATPVDAPAKAAATTSSGSASSGAASSGSASSAGSAKARATAAADTSDAANAAVQAATGGTTTTKRSTGGGSTTRTVARRPAVAKPAKVTLRVVSVERRTTMNKRSLGLLVPGTTGNVARVVKVSDSNRVVVLRLRPGAALTGKQSPGTRCVERVDGTGACRLITVHTGNAAVIKAPRTRGGRPGAITALRVLSVWRGGLKVAD